MALAHCSQAVLPPLNDLLGDITLPPSLVLALRDTQPAQNPDLWLQAIVQLEEKMAALKARPGVKATAEMEGVIEGLRLKALTQLPPFLLSLIRPLKSASKGLSTNLAVLQTSLLLKYQPFYAFLLRQSPKIAKQVERGYVNAARAYYETGMRRYARALAQIRARTVEKAVPLGVVVPDAQATNAPKGAIGTSAQRQAYDRLQYADLNVEGEAGQLILAYMADDKDLVSASSSHSRQTADVLIASTGGSVVPLAQPGTARQCFRRVHIHCPLLCPCGSVSTSPAVIIRPARLLASRNTARLANRRRVRDRQKSRRDACRREHEAARRRRSGRHDEECRADMA